MKELNFSLIHVYGLTEAYGPYTICEWHTQWDTLPIAQQARLLARQGQGNVLTDRVRVVDEQMHDVPADGSTMGEVTMHDNCVMAGFFEDAEATATAFEGGWFHSGDLAVCHPDG